MSFFEIVRQILRSNPEGLTPQQIRDIVKGAYPAFYGTESHRRNVESGNYKDLDHALVAQIYIAARSAAQIVVDRTQKPMKLALASGATDEVGVADEPIDTESLEKLEEGAGTLYLLGTNLFTKDGKEIIKIGITSGSVESRITQLYTTGVPFRFRILK